MPLDFRINPLYQISLFYEPDANMRMFSLDLHEFFAESNYCSLEKLGFLPVLTSHSIINRSFTVDECVSVHHDNKWALEFVYVEANQYNLATSYERIELFYNAILWGCKLLEEKIDFDLKSFERDYKEFWELNREKYYNWKPIVTHRKGRPPIKRKVTKLQQYQKANKKRLKAEEERRLTKRRYRKILKKMRYPHKIPYLLFVRPPRDHKKKKR